MSMSNPIKAPSFLSPMNYSVAAKVLGVFLVLLGFVVVFKGGSAAMIAVGALLLIISGMMKDIQRNYVGLVLLTNSIGQDIDILKEHEQKIEAASLALGEMTKMLLVLKDGLETTFQHNRTLEDEIHRLQQEIDNLKNPPYMAGDL